MAKKTKTYTSRPVVPASLQARYQAVLEVLSGKTTVSAAAQRLGLARNHFQSIMNRGLAGMIEGLEPKTPGRPGKSAEELERAKKAEQLRRENERLSERVGTIDRLLGVASGLLRGQIKLTGRREKASPAAPTTSTSTSPEKDDESSDPESQRIRTHLEGARTMRSLGLCAVLAAAVIGVSTSTMRRWSARERSGRPLRERRGGAAAPRVSAETSAQVVALVRALRGLPGADALRHAVPGVSRRRAAALKRETVTAMERERVARTTRVHVAVPGVLRGFDAMHVGTTHGMRYVLVSADACVPQRTSAPVVVRYDGPAVAAALDADFARHGAPLVLRADRARAHETPDVLAVLRAHRVLLLHGPPRHPRYYGQLERQNREHRAWLDAAGELDPDALAAECARMVGSLSTLWPRRTLGWCTASDAWERRPALVEDRAALREEVDDRAARLRRHLDARGAPAGLAERLAIEQALIARGYLRLEVGGWC
jgi:transposase